MRCTFRHRLASFLRTSSWGTLSLLYLALVVRIYFAALTAGTYDVSIWKFHIHEITDRGLLSYYKDSLNQTLAFNHPPLMGYLMVVLDKISHSLGLEFSFLYRLLFGLSDFVSAYFLWQLLAGISGRTSKVFFFLLSPAAVLLSSYHGNTDGLVALFALASLLFFAKGQYFKAGFVLGFGVSVKWIVLLVAPALFFAIPIGREKVKFCSSVVASIAVGFGWWFLQEPITLFRSVFGYRGQMFFSAAGQPIWGNQVFIKPILEILGVSANRISESLDLLYQLNGPLIILTIIAFCFLRRELKQSLEVGQTIAGSFCLFYAITNFWAYQYFAWALPFYVLLDWPGCLLLSVCSVYLYACYTFFCDSWRLAGSWDFIGHSPLPLLLILIRDVTIFTFMAIGLELLLVALPRLSRNRCSGFDGAKD